MNNNQNSHFLDGLILGAVLGGATVFLLGTRTGKNLLRILSEQGLDGLVNTLEEYDLGEIDDMEEFPEEAVVNGEKKHMENTEEKTSPTPKKRFFKRIRR